MWPSGGRGPLPCSYRQWPVPTPPNETTGLQLRDVAAEMPVPPCVAPPSSGGAPWAWYSYTGVSSATQDTLVSTSLSQLCWHHRQPLRPCEGRQTVGQLLTDEDPGAWVRTSDATMGNKHVHMYTHVCQMTLCLLCPTAQQPQNLQMNLPPWAGPHQLNWSLVN